MRDKDELLDKSLIVMRIAQETAVKEIKAKKLRKLCLHAWVSHVGRDVVILRASRLHRRRRRRDVVRPGPVVLPGQAASAVAAVAVAVMS
jgi:hypothetical protein